MRTNAKAFLAAVTTMLAMGIIYLWGVFLLGLEQELQLSRATVSIVSSLALVSFTLAMSAHGRILNAIPLQAYVALTFGLAAGGHLLFGLAPTYVTLLVGYGVMFGAGAGFGYGLALALATRTGDASRSLVIGVIAAVFALSGVLLALAAPILFVGQTTAAAFAKIGFALLVAGVLVATLLAGAPGFETGSAAAASRREDRLFSSLFVKISVAFFVFNYVGLMLVAHGVGMLDAAGLSRETASLGPVALNLSYIIGSLAGGRIAEALSARVLLVAVNALAALGVLLLLGASSVVALVGGIALIGFVFGSAAAFTPVLVGRFWGVERINRVYGLMMFGYGAAGILAPWASAALFSVAGDYTLALWLALAICVAGGALSTTLAAAHRNRSALA
ncbi:MAG: hypothetical protein DI565_09280 [Ancylobacter novellus]|uniref:Major facilitator superfamily (MFS) profile domain-containing protein n=1 Tax=Ancylobacter novellus TaxID=921 RepID=A0A2W5MQU3_ANCNO|nr:MAG: hypothetical protein DI565_09280 [Ancylobacter novellus]